ncbi:hypothetical protein L1080_033590 [Rhodococcus sp. MSC1_016]|jgi:hypothetical protein|uniref:hypothetical protein n=1 Tax=Rhodococcus sp. MSC1_016 TaxID=2909266 RepID=UPI00202E6D50|nr:hypothetical protein [Rhodococcus sp. MSC1_016]
MFVNGSVHTMDRRRLLTAVVALTALISGCSLIRGPAPDRDPAEIVAAAVCRMPQGSELLGVTPPAELMRAPSPRPGTVPSDFEPVAAITCDEWLANSVAADLTGSFAEHRWEGDFAAAIDKLNAPSEGQRLDQNSCGTASLAPIPDLWLIDARGRALRPSYPVDDCGFLKIGGLREIEKLDQVDRIEHYVRHTPDSLQQLMGCSTRRVTPEIGIQPLFADQYWVRSAVCRYTTDPDGTITFTGAEELQDSLGQTFFSLPLANNCSSVASLTAGTTVTLAGPEYVEPLAVLIEIDGCRRVLIDEHIALQASDDVIAQVS